MSATCRKKAGGTSKERNARDLYPTPHWAIRAVFRRLAIDSDDEVIDPCCGDGRIMSVAEARGATGWGWDIDPVGDFPKFDSLGDAPWGLASEAWVSKKRQTIITNPPFSKALEFVERAIAEAYGRPIAMLLPVPFLASETRFRFNTEHPCHVMVLPKRPSFTPNGKTDAVTYAWLVWNYGTKGTYEVLNVWGDT